MKKRPSEDEAVVAIGEFFREFIKPVLIEIPPKERRLLDIGSRSGRCALEIANAIDVASVTMVDLEDHREVPLDGTHRYEVVDAESPVFQERFMYTHNVHTVINAFHEMRPGKFVMNVLPTLPVGGRFIAIDHDESSWRATAAMVDTLPLAQRLHIESDLSRLRVTGMYRNDIIEKFWRKDVNRSFPGHVDFAWIEGGAYVVVYTAAPWGHFKPYPG